MKFIDEVTIDVQSGKGGPGSVHFMRQKYMPNMGPDGGDGGRGGDVIFVASPHMQSLLDFKYISRYEAQDGQKGMGKQCNGRDGLSKTVAVPMGTLVKNAETGEVLVDLVEEGREILLLKGGKGGLGNMNFATPTRQAPDFAQPGLPGAHLKIRLELKLLADVALVGFPNAGKSTLISRLSAARPKIADYPFTTLVPNLGVVRGKKLDFVLADIPGLIEGASHGKGLGIKFLRHCERTRVLLLLLDLDPYTGRKLDQEYLTLLNELSEFSPELMNKPRIVVMNKLDAFGEEQGEESFQNFLVERGYPELKKILGKDPLWISAQSGRGVDPLKEAVENELVHLGPRVFQNQIHENLILGSSRLLEQGDAVEDL